MGATITQKGAFTLVGIVTGLILLARSIPEKYLTGAPEELGMVASILLWVSGHVAILLALTVFILALAYFRKLLWAIVIMGIAYAVIKLIFVFS